MKTSSLTMNHRLVKRIYSTLISIFCFFCIVATAWATQQEFDIVEPAQPLQLEQEAVVDFEYILEGRPDPFVPFISPKAVTTGPLLNPNEIIDEDVELTGMRQFEPGQLTLAAVLSSNGQKMAMVEDVSGKGYILNEGMPIGKRGVVSQIKQQQVLITETARTRAGKELVNTVIMRLKKEGDE